MSFTCLLTCKTVVDHIHYYGHNYNESTVYDLQTYSELIGMTANINIKMLVIYVHLIISAEFAPTYLCECGDPNIKYSLDVLGLLLLS